MRLPAPLRWLWNLWQAMGKKIGIVMGFIILTIVWVIIFGIYALFVRIARLFRRRTPSASYWVDIPPALPDDAAHAF